MEDLLLQYQSAELKTRSVMWNRLFDLHFSKSMCMSEKTLEAVGAAHIKYDWVNKQSEVSFLNTLSFYDKVLKFTRYISIPDYEAAEFLLKVGYIYARFNKNTLQDVRTAVKHIDGDVTIADIEKLFINLFCKWEVPAYLVRHMVDFEFEDIDVLMFHLRGQNIRNHRRLKGYLSKKEAHTLIYDMPKDFEFPDLHFDRAIIVAKILSKRVEGSELLKQMLEVSNEFFVDLTTFRDNLQKWGELYVFLVDNDVPKTSRHEMQEIVDYFTSAIHRNRNFSLSGRTVQSLDRLIDHWHENIGLGHYDSDNDYLERTWEPVIKNLQVDFNDESYQLIELTSGKMLLEESEAMKHCAFSYTGWCSERDEIIVFSLRQVFEDKTFERLATVEIRQGEVVQVAGKENQTPEPMVFELVECFEKVIAEDDRLELPVKVWDF